MWDNNTPLQLLKTMPKKLNQDNLAKIQMIIDADKYKNSLVSGFDLCGIYAPFCRGCDKTSIYPCAIAYIRMLQSEGMNIQIDASPMGGLEPAFRQPPVEIRKSEPIVSEQRISRPKVKAERRPYESKYQPPVVEPLAEIAVTKPEKEPVINVPVIEESVYKAPVKSEPPVIEKVAEEKPVEISAAEEVVVEEPVEVKVEAPAVVEPVVQYDATAKPVKNKIRIAVARRKL